jgi:hypothetical protein
MTRTELLRRRREMHRRIRAAVAERRLAITLRPPRPAQPEAAEEAPPAAA